MIVIFKQYFLLLLFLFLLLLLFDPWKPSLQKVVCVYDTEYLFYTFK